MISIVKMFDRRVKFKREYIEDDWAIHLEMRAHQNMINAHYSKEIAFDAVAQPTEAPTHFYTFWRHGRPRKIPLVRTQVDGKF